MLSKTGVNARVTLETVNSVGAMLKLALGAIDAGFGKPRAVLHPVSDVKTRSNTKHPFCIFIVISYTLRSQNREGNNHNSSRHAETMTRKMKQ